MPPVRAGPGSAPHISRGAASLRGGPSGAAPATPWRRSVSQHVGLHQMVPTTAPAHLDYVYRELFASLGQPDQFLGGSGRARDRSQTLAVDPRYESQLLPPADRACDLAPPPVEFGRPQQVRIRIAHFGDRHSARIDIGEQRPAPERIVDYLPLNSHAPRVLVSAGARHYTETRTTLDVGQLYRSDIVGNRIHRLGLFNTLRR